MSGEHEERIIEAGLEEVLGGHYPPDLTAKILQTLGAQSTSPRTVSAGDNAASSPLVPQSALSAPPAPPVQATIAPAPPPVQPEPVVRVRGDSRTRRSSNYSWTAMAVAVSILAVAVLAGLYGSRVYLGPPVGHDLAGSSSGGSHNERASQEHDAVVTDGERDRAARWGTQQDQVVPPVPSVLIAAALPDTWIPTDTSPADSASGHPPTRHLPKPSADADVLAFINDVLREAWQEHSVTASPPATDDQWCRRVYQRLVGREPSSDELDRFLRGDQAGRREQLVDQLLASDEYAHHFADLWCDVLVDTRQDQESDDLYDREELVEYLEDSFRDDKSYDRLVHELLSATGSSDPDSEDYNGAVNFLLAGAANDASVDTDRTARAFLGKQLVCTRCHSHPASGWEQGDFWELNAFFRQMKVRQGSEPDAAQLVDQDFYGESGAARDAEIFYQLADGRLEVAYPTLGEREISHSGLLSDVNRRRELAKLLTGSVDFRRAVTNRVWSWLMGYGFTQPVDDMGPHNPPSHPQLLSRLANELAAHDFHPDSLVRWIVLSEAFGLSDKQMPESWMDSPETGGRPLFARWYKEDDQPEDIYHALVRVVHSRSTDVGSMRGTLARRTWLRPSVGPLRIIETQPDVAFPGPTWLPRLAKSPMRPEKKIEHVFLSVLSRYPTAHEMKAAKLVLADRMDDRVAIQEVWQTLLTSDPSDADLAAR